MEFISRALGAQKKEKRCLRSDGGDKGGSTPPGGPAGRNLNFGCSQMPSPCISQRVLTLTLTLISNPNPIPKPVQTCFSAYFRCSQVCFPCISQRLHGRRVRGSVGAIDPPFLKKSYADCPFQMKNRPRHKSFTLRPCNRKKRDSVGA